MIFAECFCQKSRRQINRLMSEIQDSEAQIMIKSKSKRKIGHWGFLTLSLNPTPALVFKLR
jgi:hypothetical protein